MLHIIFYGFWSICSAEEDFYGFLLHIGLADMVDLEPGRLNKFSFPQSLEALHEIWLQSAQ